MTETTQHTPADMRERVAKEVYLWEATRVGADDSWALRSWREESNTRRRLYFNVADRILAILRTPRGEGEADTLWRDFEAALVEFEGAALALGRREALPLGPREAAIDRVVQARRRVIACARALAALRSDAQGEEDVGEFCDLCGEEFDPRESGTVIGPLGQDDGLPRWYRCPRCARAYDAGYQQGQRDPRGDETADPTALRSDAQGDDHWEDLVFGPITEAYNEAHAARRGEGGGNDA